MSGNERQRVIQTVSLIGSYVPRQCGIGTFTKDLRDALAAELGGGQAMVLALDDEPNRYPYPSEVRFQIAAHEPADYRTAAELLNINQIDLTVVQHEFGIFGGKDGAHILELMRRLRMPIMTTLHTILREPSSNQRRVMLEIARTSDRLVVMSRLAERILVDVYDVPREKIVFIPHGIPDVSFRDSSSYKGQFGFEGRTVLMTYGLLSPSKGVEVAIQAMPRIIEQHPEALYVVLGATHPNILKHEGNAYRHSLERWVDRLQLHDHVTFHNRFVTIEELLRYLCATDVYLTPYPNQAQITSGTLAYAVGVGAAVVSTPYWYAEEMLADGRGRLFPFGDSAALAATVNELLGDETQRQAIRQRAYEHGRSMIWKRVAASYLQAASDATLQRQFTPRRAQRQRLQPIKLALPEISLAHLRRLTDDTGILQHAIYSIPDRHHGYCTDDNSRALVVVMMHYDLNRDESIMHLADTYIAFLYHAFNPEHKRFRNFMGYDRQWHDPMGTDDVHGRCVWALGLTVAMAPNNAILSFATRLIHVALEKAGELQSPRAWAHCLVGIDAYLQRFAGDTFARRIRGELAARLHRQFVQNGDENWPWCEDTVTYDNARLPHALIITGQATEDKAMLDQGLCSLSWLVQLQCHDEKTVSLIGNQGWMKRSGERAKFDQQPIEAMALVEACAEAFRQTKDLVWARRARQCLDWFLGGNEVGCELYDFHTGGCRDGLHADGPNLNQGAESTLAWLIALLCAIGLNRRQDIIVPESPVEVYSPDSQLPHIPQ